MAVKLEDEGGNWLLVGDERCGFGARENDGYGWEADLGYPTFVG